MFEFAFVKKGPELQVLTQSSVQCGTRFFPQSKQKSIGDGEHVLSIKQIPKLTFNANQLKFNTQHKSITLPPAQPK